MAIGIPGLSTTDERVRGYRDGARGRRARVRPRAASPRAARSATARATAMHALLDLADPPTAVVSGNNFMTIGLLRAIAERGLTVPDDIALVAFDDFEWADLFAPRLTVIRQPTDRARLARGRAAALAARRSRPAAAHGAPGGDVRAPRLVRLHSAQGLR